MLAFGRLASFVLFVLSLSLLSCAAPTGTIHAPKSAKHMLAARGHHEGAGNVKVVLGAVIDLKAKVVAQADKIVNINADEARGQVGALIASIQLCSNTIGSLHNLNVDAKLKASIAAHVLVIIKAIIKICASLTTKFGIQVFLELFAELDLCLKTLLRSLDGCMDGFLVVLGKLLVEADLRALIEAKLIVCHDLFILIRAAVGITAGASVAL